MITKNNTFSGAGFSYESEKATATGEIRLENGRVASINISGQLGEHNFWANLDAAGNVNVSGVPASVIAEAAGEVAVVIAEAEEAVKE